MPGCLQAPVQPKVALPADVPLMLRSQLSTPSAAPGHVTNMAPIAICLIYRFIETPMKRQDIDVAHLLDMYGNIQQVKNIIEHSCCPH